MPGRHCVVFCCGFAIALISGRAAGEDHPHTETGFFSKLSYDRTVGKYGRGRNTTIDLASLTLGYNFDDYSFDVMVPYVRQRGPGRLIFVAGRQPTVIAGPIQNVSGAGDVTSSLTRYLLNEEDHGVDLDLGAIFKLATASASRNLGTGENDFAVQSSLGRSCGIFNTSLTLGYTYVGKSKGGDYQNGSRTERKSGSEVYVAEAPLRSHSGLVRSGLGPSIDPRRAVADRQRPHGATGWLDPRRRGRRRVHRHGSRRVFSACAGSASVVQPV